VGTFVVEDLDELIEPGLLLQKIPGRRLGGFFLQREMHAFVAAVLLWVTWLDPFDADVKSAACPPTSAAITACPLRPRMSCSNLSKLAVWWLRLGKKPLKCSECVAFFGGRECLASKQKTAGMIGDR